jgi:hypothetical protein
MLGQRNCNYYLFIFFYKLHNDAYCTYIYVNSFYFRFVVLLMILKCQIYQYFHNPVALRKTLKLSNSIPFDSSISTISNAMQSMLPFTQNSNNNLPLHVSSSPQQPIPTLEEFFSKLDEEFLQFKNIFEDERFTVDQIYDLTDIEFDQLGISKIGWRKAFRVVLRSGWVFNGSIRIEVQLQHNVTRNNEYNYNFVYFYL